MFEPTEGRDETPLAAPERGAVVPDGHTVGHRADDDQIALVNSSTDEDLRGAVE